jgi:hydrogenase maturation protease
MSDRAGRVLVAGVGNVLLGDDGVGVRVVEALERMTEHDPTALPPGARLLDGGTQGIDLLRHLDGATALVLVDAVDFGLAPGTVKVLRGDRITSPGRGAGPSRGGGVGELLALARLMDLLPTGVALVGIQGAEIEVGMTLSRMVGAALPAAIEAVRAEAWAMAPARARELAGTMP